MTHPYLVAEQEDVILECIDSRDITIRVKALDLVQGMVSSDNLVSIVSRLMRQLKGSVLQKGPDMEFSNDYEPESQIPKSINELEMPPLPEDYRVDVMNRILFMCSQTNYANITDFDWYIDILTQLVRSAPLSRAISADPSSSVPGIRNHVVDVAENIGDELRNVAVKVRAVRLSAVRAGETIVARINADTPTSHPIASGALIPVWWMLGEYANLLSSPQNILNLMLQMLPRATSPGVLTIGLQSITKILAVSAVGDTVYWTAEQKSSMALLLARIINTFESLALHPNLEVQERAVEFVELLKLTAEAASSQPASTDDFEQDTPLLLTQAIPSLFAGWELNSIAHGAQYNVPIPEHINLDEPIHPNLVSLLAATDQIQLDADETDDFDAYYHRRPEPTSISIGPAINRLAEPPSEMASSYQHTATDDSYLDADILARRKAERLEKNRDDPFYIGMETGSVGASTPIHNILQTSNGPDLDIDTIPVMSLDLDKLSSVPPSGQPKPSTHAKKSRPRNIPQRVVVAADETLGGVTASTPQSEQYGSDGLSSRSKNKAVASGARGLLGVDSSNIGSLNLEGSQIGAFEKQQKEDAEMAAAVKEVERLRLEMQRASERIQIAEGVEVVSVKSKKKKAVRTDTAVGSRKKRVSTKTPTSVAHDGSNAADVSSQETKSKKKKVNISTKSDVLGVPSSSRPTNIDGDGERDIFRSTTKPKKKKKMARIAEIE